MRIRVTTMFAAGLVLSFALGWAASSKSIADDARRRRPQLSWADQLAVGNDGRIGIAA